MKDLFILHANAEEDLLFIRSFLLPALRLPSSDVSLSSELPLGEPTVRAVEQALDRSRLVLLILSPAFLRESWGIHCEAIASCHAVKGRRLVPVLIADCDLPTHLEMLVRLDLRARHRRTAELMRLRTFLSKLKSSQAVETGQVTAVIRRRRAVTLPGGPLFKINRARVAAAAFIAALSLLTVMRCRQLGGESPEMDATPARGGSPSDTPVVGYDPVSPEPTPPKTSPIISAPPPERDNRSTASTPCASATRILAMRETEQVDIVKTAFKTHWEHRTCGRALLAQLIQDGRFSAASALLEQYASYREVMVEVMEKVWMRQDYRQVLQIGKALLGTVNDPDVAWKCVLAACRLNLLEIAESYFPRLASDKKKLFHNFCANGRPR